MRELEEIKAERQGWKDLGFLGLFALLLAASGFAVVHSAYPPHRSHTTASGQIRAIDPPVLREQLRSGRLSDHKALHWRRAGSPRVPPARAGGTP